MPPAHTKPEFIGKLFRDRCDSFGSIYLITGIISEMHYSLMVVHSKCQDDPGWKVGSENVVFWRFLNRCELVSK